MLDVTEQRTFQSQLQRERDFNQAEVLAKLISKSSGRPVLHALKRTRYTTTQTTLDREERMENLRNAFRVRHIAAVQNRHLLIVDDVFTTGSTVDECARVLRLAGAASAQEGAMSSDHMASSAMASDHMASDHMASDHMAAKKPMAKKKPMKKKPMAHEGAMGAEGAMSSGPMSH